MRKYKLVCKTSFADILLQIILWTILIMITFGLAAPFFIYYIIRMIINQTEIHEIEDGGTYSPDNKSRF